MRKPLELAYVNAAGDRIDFAADGYANESNPMRGYSWNYDASGKRVTRFYKNAAEIRIEAWIDSWSEYGGFEMRDKLLEVAEKDVRGKTPGTFHVGEWYAEGYIVASEPKGYITDGRHMTTGLTVLLPDPVWYRDEFHQFLPYAEQVKAAYLDYPYDYHYDYLPPEPARTFKTAARYPSEFRLIVYGGATGTVNPAVRIGGNLYEVSVRVLPGGYLEIDSRERTVRLYASDGTWENVIDRRNRGVPKGGSYIFERIPPDASYATVSGGAGADLIIYTESSVPPWTSS